MFASHSIAAIILIGFAVAFTIIKLLMIVFSSTPPARMAQKTPISIQIRKSV